MRNDYLKKYMLFLVLLLAAQVTFAQTGTITGKVVDENQQPLPGATVSLQGTTQGGTTDPSGVYRISNVKAGSYTLVASFIGYTSLTKQVTVAGGSNVADFNLQPASKTLGEIVVIGYGTARKKDVTGAITTVTSKDFQTGNITTPEQLISGKVAGVSITSNGGAPGVGSTIRIRGGASLNASNDPLIVVDGVQLSNESIPGSPSPLSLINPNDIESFTVLKDASATAIYGSRASNGVIIITTKKGSGKMQVNANVQGSVSYLPKEVSVLTADELRAYVAASGKTAYQNLPGKANTNWQKEIYNTAINSDVNVSIAGAAKWLPYRVSVGNLNQNGILKTGYVNRTSAAINLSPMLLDNHLKIDLNVKGSLSKNRFANQDAIGAAVFFDPTQPVYSTNPNKYGGFFEYLDADPTSTTGLKQQAPRNPLGLLLQKEDRSDVRRSIGNAQLDYKFHFLPDLHANVNFGYDISEGKGTIFIPPGAAAGYLRYKDASNILHSGTDNQYRTTIKNTTFEAYLNYSKDIKAVNSRIEAVAGYAYYDYLRTDYGFPDRTTDGTIVTNANFPFNKPQNRLISFYGRLNLTIADKYVLTGTIRRDGSSRFSPLNRWAVFPSGAFAWRLKEEDFLKDNTVLSDLKLRVGYGLTGQQDGLGNYEYTSYYNLSNSTASYQLGSTYYQLYRPAAYDPKRKWEQSATTNVAIDYGFLNGRISGSIDAYYKDTKDLLGVVNVAAGAGFSNSFVTNVGNMTNRGIEFSITGQVVRSKNVQWDVNYNLTYNQNKITKLTFLPDPNGTGTATGGISGGTGNNIQRNILGYPRATFYAYQQVYGADGKPIDNVYVDRNGDGIVNDKDLYLYKSPDPKFFMGFSTNVSYKKWTAGVVMRASLGNYAYNNVFSNAGTQSAILNPLGYLNNGSTNVLESGLLGGNDKNVLSDYYITNASFLKMDNVNLGYNFGKIFGYGQGKSAMLSLNANVQNVFIVTKYKGVDPEIGGGIDNNLYPRPRTFVLGANLKF